MTLLEKALAFGIFSFIHINHVLEHEQPHSGFTFIGADKIGS